jgi:hypothetical protein
VLADRMFAARQLDGNALEMIGTDARRVAPLHIGALAAG